MANIGRRVRRRRWEPLPDAPPPAPSPQRKEPQREEKSPSRKKEPVREKVGEPA